MSISVNSRAPKPTRGRSAQLQAALEILLIVLLFFIHAASPAPEVNEPHYLGKAKHYWNPDWCAHDFFFQTADAHQVFYWTVGWLTRWMPLAQVAWCGRIATWVLLAWAWRRLSFALIPAAFYSVLSAALFLVLNDRMHMAGEWVIGGVEAKGFAYVLVFVGLERLVRGRWKAAILAFGAASALHVIIGAWAVVAVAFVWITSRDRPSIASLVPALALGLLLALPGLLPALSLTWGVPGEIVRAANRIYVYERLYHHLLPTRFPPWFVVRHSLLILALGLLAPTAPATAAFNRLRAFIAAAVLIAVIGMAIGLAAPLAPDLAASVLRYYWFRMSDVMVPLGVALIAAALVRNWQFAWHQMHAAALAGAILVVSFCLGHTVWRRAQDPRPPADSNIANLPAWRELCEWIAEHTPQDAVFLTPRLDQTFHWYAGRAEVVSRKDIPQDARGIVEWWRRNLAIYAVSPSDESSWHDSLAELGSNRLIELGQEFGADYVITSAYPSVNLQRVGPPSASYAIYRLPRRPTTLERETRE
jgi:hypothetical protein